MDDTGKMHMEATPAQHESRKKQCKVDPTLVSSETDDSDASENKRNQERKALKELKAFKELKALKKLKKLKEKQKYKKQKKIIKELNNRVDVLTEAVEKLEKSQVVQETSLKVEEKECCFESEGAGSKNPQTIFVKGFDCSFPREEIRSTLIKHFSSCGEVVTVFIPFHCKTGSPLGFAFINMVEYPHKALKLDGSCLQGQRLLVTMALNRDEYIGYKHHDGCKRCRNAIMKRRLKLFHESFRMRIRLDTCTNPGEIEQ
uniref:Nucleolin 1 n=1 Tax=Noccaea caerulescens TaxID=107243 RepID=A0A1J3HPI4_NOCCA